MEAAVRRFAILCLVNKTSMVSLYYLLDEGQTLSEVRRCAEVFPKSEVCREEAGSTGHPSDGCAEHGAQGGKKDAATGSKVPGALGSGVKEHMNVKRSKLDLLKWYNHNPDKNLL